MINEVRTLLLNRNGAGLDSQDFAAEFVPAEYVAANLPTSLLRIRQSLFGRNPDTDGLNYRLRQFTALLHAPDIEAYTRRRDSRITYPTGSLAAVDAACFRQSTGLSVEQLRGSVAVSLVGALPQDRDGRLRRSWLVTATDTDFVDIDPLQSGSSPQSAEVTWSESLSSLLPLPGVSGLFFRLGGTSIVQSTIFRITLLSAPVVGLADLPGLVEAVLDSESERLLFPARSDLPYRAWWFDSSQLHFRLCGLLLALADATDVVRKQGV